MNFSLMITVTYRKNKKKKAGEKAVKKENKRKVMHSCFAQ